MFDVVLIFHVLVCLGLILVVLMQSSKGEGLAGGTAFGGAMSTAVFGGRGAASFLSKATTILAVLFMLNCGALAFMSADSSAVATEGTVDSAVTRKAQEAINEQQQRQQRLNDAAVNQDTTAGTQPVDLLNEISDDNASDGEQTTPEPTGDGQ